jgi:hypothetical protein
MSRRAASATGPKPRSKAAEPLCLRTAASVHQRQHDEECRHDGRYGGYADQTAMNKEMAMANTDMSNGKMVSACTHYMKAQKAMTMK